MRVPLIAAVLVISAILALGSCTSIKPPIFNELVVALKVTKFEGKKHPLLVISNSFPIKNKSNVNIYLEGDGRPWLNRYEVSDNPTPEYPLALHLMSVDPGPAFYLTRPCYHDPEMKNCNAELWTSGRYSQEVVDAMSEGLNSILANLDSTTRVTLVGYSGGATLALLLAAQVDGIDQVVTVAGNLDIAAWTDFHDYSPLKNSINPAAINLPDSILYLHFAGSKDKNIPPELGISVYSRPGHTLHVMQGFDHRCCWVDSWLNLLTFATNPLL